MSNKYRKLTIFAVIAAGLVVRLWTVSERSFWHDEAFSYSLAREASWSEMLQRTAGDVHPPLSYALIRLWSYMSGTSEIGLRLFSVFFSMTTLFGCYLFCRDLFNDSRCNPNEFQQDGQWIGISAVALVGSSSLHIKWSQEARMYTLGTTLVFFSTWMLVRAIRASRKSSRKWWYGYALTATALGYTHNFGLFSIAGQGLWCIGQILCSPFVSVDKRENLWSRCVPATAAFLAVGIGYLPWASVLLAQTRQAKLEFWTPKMHIWSIPNCFGQLVLPTNSSVPDHTMAMGVTVVIASVAALLIWRARSTEWLLLSMMLVPMAFATALSLTAISVIIERYFLFAYMFLLCAVPHLARLWLPVGVRNGLIVLLVANSLIVHAYYWVSLDTGHRPGMRAAVAYLSEGRRPGEIVVVADLKIYFSARYYLRNSEPPRFFVRKGKRPEPYFLGGSAVATEWMIEEEQLQYRNLERIWIIGTPSHGLSSALSDRWKPATDSIQSYPDTYFFLPNVTVTAYDRRANPPVPQ